MVGKVSAGRPLRKKKPHVNRLLPGRVGTPDGSGSGGGLSSTDFFDRLDAREESRLRREEEREKKKKSPNTVYGELCAEKLLTLTGYESWDDMPDDHVLKVFLKCNKSEWRNNLQSRLESLAREEGYLGLKIAVSDNDVKALVLAVPFRYGTVDVGQAQKQDQEDKPPT